MFAFPKIVLILAVITTALMAGLFYSWSVSVMPGIARLPDSGFLSAFQEMNRAILNPLFFICFMGAALLLPAATFLQYKQPVPARFWLLLAATLCYLIGIIGVTMAGNVPLNESLDVFNVQTATAKELADKRASFEGTWNRLNNIRTVAGILTTLLVTVACLVRDEQ